MSSPSSPESGSSQSGQATSGRYSRAGQTALQRAPTELDRQRSKDRASRYASQVQAQQDAEANARRLTQLSGRSSEIEQVTALLSGEESPDKSRTSATGDREHLGNGNASLPGNARDKAGGDGIRPSHVEPPPADDFPDEDDEDRGSGKSDRPKTLADYAGERELDLDELYGLTVTTDDGESYSIEQLKDGAKKIREIDDREAEFEDQREHLWNEIAVKRQNVEALLNRLKAYVPAETLARAAAEAEGDPEETRTRSIRQLREWFPEWKDNQVQQRDRERVETWLSAYGVSKYEVASLNDARIIRILVESARKLERYDRLRATRPDKIPTTAAPSGRARPPSRKTTTADRAQAQVKANDPVGAIATLLEASKDGHYQP